MRQAFLLGGLVTSALVLLVSLNTSSVFAEGTTFDSIQVPGAVKPISAGGGVSMGIFGNDLAQYYEMKMQDFQKDFQAKQRLVQAAEADCMTKLSALKQQHPEPAQRVPGTTGASPSPSITGAANGTTPPTPNPAMNQIIVECRKNIRKILGLPDTIPTASPSPIGINPGIKPLPSGGPTGIRSGIYPTSAVGNAAGFANTSAH